MQRRTPGSGMGRGGRKDNKRQHKNHSNYLACAVCTGKGYRSWIYRSVARNAIMEGSDPIHWPVRIVGIHAAVFRKSDQDLVSLLALQNMHGESVELKCGSPR